MHSPGLSFDPRPEEKIRRSLLILWIIVVSGIAWLLSYAEHFSPKAVLVASIVTLASIPAGWLFGYKLGFAPLFCGFYIFHKPEETASPAKEK